MYVSVPSISLRLGVSQCLQVLPRFHSVGHPCIRPIGCLLTLESLELWISPGIILSLGTLGNLLELVLSLGNFARHVGPVYQLWFKCVSVLKEQKMCKNDRAYGHGVIMSSIQTFQT
jgi:hypothetical protein